MTVSESADSGFEEKHQVQYTMSAVFVCFFEVEVELRSAFVIIWKLEDISFEYAICFMQVV